MKRKSIGTICNYDYLGAGNYEHIVIDAKSSGRFVRDRRYGVPAAFGWALHILDSSSHARVISQLSLT